MELWQESKYFRDKFISIGWNFSQPACMEHVSLVSADTETKMYYKNKLLTSEEAYKLYKLLRHRVSRRRLATENKGLGRNIRVGIFYDLVIERDYLQYV